jgi:hypothetical protein
LNAGSIKPDEPAGCSSPTLREDRDVPGGNIQLNGPGLISSLGPLLSCQG